MTRGVHIPSLPVVDAAAPGYLVYEEYLAAASPAGRAPHVEIREESARASYPAKNLAGTRASG